MKNLFSLFIAACFALALAMPVWAENAMAVPESSTVASQASPALQACPAPGQAITLSQVSQSDCCKGHKGVCGCRAGKIVCCDNTVSPNCTCHADSGIEN